MEITVLPMDTGLRFGESTLLLIAEKTVMIVLFINRLILLLSKRQYARRRLC